MRSLILSFVVALMACIAAGQSSNRGSSGTGNVNQANVQTIRGCLSKSGNTYTLLGNNPVRQYRIIGGQTAALKGKQEHTVEITGKVGEKISGASSNGEYDAGSTTGVGYDTIRVESVKDIAPNCG